MIEVKNLVKRYGDAVAVDDVSFSVGRGEILGFLGPNGAGKSTTMKIVTTYIGADGGSASVAGHDVFAEPLEVRRRVGYLPEHAPLYLDMGIVEFLTYVCELRGLRGAERRESLARVIEVCGLAREITKIIGALSKGYRQRVALAQALIHNPDVLILDEPTSGLDPNQIVEIRSLIRRIGSEKTVILSTHNLSEATSACDRAIIINRGRLVAGGSPEELQRLSAGASVVAAIRGPRPEVEDALRGLDGIDAIVDATTLGPEVTRYSLKTTGAEGVAETVFALVAARGWSLAELRSELASLEDVFRSLTIESPKE